jgi:ERCC4-type nuclease
MLHWGSVLIVHQNICDILMMDAAGSSGMLVIAFETMRYGNTEDNSHKAFCSTFIRIQIVYLIQVFYKMNGMKTSSLMKTLKSA